MTKEIKTINTLILVDDNTIDNNTLSSVNISYLNNFLGLYSAKSVDNHLLIRGIKNNHASRVHLEPVDYLDADTQSKLDWMLDPYELDQSQYRIFNIYTQNDYSYGTSGFAFLGTKNTGDNHYGINTMLNFGFNDNNQNGGVAKMLYLDHSDTEFRPTFKGAWREGKTVVAGDFIVSNFKLYEVVTGGVIGATRPTHNSGNETHEGIEYTFIRDYFNSATNGDIKPVWLFGERDLMPKFGFKSCGLQIGTDVLIHNNKVFRYLDASNNQAYYQLVRSNGKFEIGGANTFIEFDKNAQTITSKATNNIFDKSVFLKGGTSNSIQFLTSPTANRQQVLQDKDGTFAYLDDVNNNILDTSSIDLQTTSTGVNDEVYSFTIPANTLEVGDILKIRFEGRDNSGDTTNKTMQLELSGQAVNTTNFISTLYSNNERFTVETEIIITSGTGFRYSTEMKVQRNIAGMNMYGNIFDGDKSTGTFDITAANDVTLDLNNVVNGDLVIKTISVKHFKA